MAENQGKAENVSRQRLAEAFEESLRDPELRKKHVEHLSAFLDSDEKIERFAKGAKVDPEELKKLLKKQQLMSHN